jgi:protein gp37
MSGKSAISWTDMTWNPTIGCTRVTAGCQECYAFALHDRWHARYLEYNGIEPKTGRSMPVQYAHPFRVVQILPQRLEDPLHIRKPQRIFVNSMSDLFHSHIPDTCIHQVFDTMVKAHWHSFQILTKRPARLARLASALPWPTNIWIGTSVELDILTPRIDLLRQVPTPNRFLSLEPLLGPLPSLTLDGICWVITGGESGPDARSCDPHRVRTIRDQYIHHHVAYFHKQWGGRTSKTGGDELDGRCWHEFPVGMVNTKEDTAPADETILHSIGHKESSTPVHR